MSRTNSHEGFCSGPKLVDFLAPLHPAAKHPSKVSPSQRSAIRCPTPQEGSCLKIVAVSKSLWELACEGAQLRDQRRKRANAHAEVSTGGFWTTAPPIAHADRPLDVSRRKIGRVALGAKSCEYPCSATGISNRVWVVPQVRAVLILNLPVTYMRPSEFLVNKLLPALTAGNREKRSPCSSKDVRHSNRRFWTRRHERVPNASQWSWHRSGARSALCKKMQKQKTKAITPLSPSVTPKQAGNTRASCRGIVDKAATDPAAYQRMTVSYTLDVFGGSCLLTKATA